MEFFLNLLFGTLLVGLWLLPIVLIARDQQMQRKEKIIWIFCVVFVSWIAWVLCMFVAPVMEPNNREKPFT